MSFPAKLLCLALSMSAFGAGKPKASTTASMSNSVVEVSARAMVAKEEVAAELGMEPPFPMILIDVKVKPLEEGKLRIDRDDFMLVSAKDGQRSQPLDPSQIAGKGVLIVKSTGTGSVGVEQGRGPAWGGIGGGPPQSLGGNGATIGSGTGETRVQTSIDTKAPESPLLAVLKKKLMPNEEAAAPVSGLLYFMFEGKPPKAKDLTLIYKGAGGGRMLLEFLPKK